VKGLLLKIPGLMLAVLVSVPMDAAACAVCFGNAEDPITKSIAWGILFLLAVIVSVLGGIAGFFIYLARRAAAVNAAGNLPAAELAATAGKV
jgi:heme/copper-type cytochrome/quinol oxidase subunit 2